MDPFGLKGAAGGSPPVVGQDGAALWQHGLLQIVVRHGPFRLGKVGADALRRGLVKDELFTKRLGQHVLSQVVAGGAQPAGGDDDIRPLLGDSHRLPGPLRIVAHYCVVVDVKPQLA